ncbi:MAG: hypothetical protein O7D91_16985 [Planctomycetota bacterium]|nr:hypothetical protein [Planctomycetota bacterium]
MGPCIVRVVNSYFAAGTGLDGPLVRHRRGVGTPGLSFSHEAMRRIPLGVLPDLLLFVAASDCDCPADAPFRFTT